MNRNCHQFSYSMKSLVLSFYKESNLRKIIRTEKLLSIFFSVGDKVEIPSRSAIVKTISINEWSCKTLIWPTDAQIALSLALYMPCAPALARPAPPHRQCRSLSPMFRIEPICRHSPTTHHAQPCQTAEHMWPDGNVYDVNKHERILYAQQGKNISN